MTGDMQKNQVIVCTVRSVIVVSNPLTGKCLQGR